MIVGRLASRQVAFHSSAEAEQIRAWEAEIVILRRSLSAIDAPGSWSLLLEVPLFRLGKRLDAVLLAPGFVIVIEFKIGATQYDAPHRVQTEGYAQALRDFHEASQSRTVVPILCAENAPARNLRLHVVDQVGDLILANAVTLRAAIEAIASVIDNRDELTIDAFERAAYRPTPTIVEAARELYAGHSIADIGRGDAADEELQAAADGLQRVVASAAIEKRHVVCFVSGAPGAGKTLLGLDLALKSRSTTSPGAFLSGNRPLVHVLTEALAVDAAARTGKSKTAAKYEAVSAIQNLLGYLKEHTDGAVPPENLIIFDDRGRGTKRWTWLLWGGQSPNPSFFLISSSVSTGLAWFALSVLARRSIVAKADWPCGVRRCPRPRPQATDGAS